MCGPDPAACASADIVADAATTATMSSADATAGTRATDTVKQES